MKTLVYCKHYACRCARAKELALVAERLANTSHISDDLLVRMGAALLESAAVHGRQVRCRRVEPKEPAAQTPAG